MRLRRFRVRAFRCIHDSGYITVGDLAAFVGRNESGKTTILQALTLLNKDEMVSDLDLCDELTDELKSEIKVTEGEFDLNENERELLEEKFPNLSIKKIIIFRTNKNPQIQYDFIDSEFSTKKDTIFKSWKNLTDDLKNFVEIIPNHVSKQLDTEFFESSMPIDKETFSVKLNTLNKTILDAASQEPQVISEWKDLYDQIMGNFDSVFVSNKKRKELEKFILDTLHPRFVYFSDYKKILGNINLNEYLKDPTTSDVGGIEYLEEFDRAETVKNLLYLAELEIGELKNASSSPSKLIKLLSTSNKKLTARLNPSWKGEPIHVELRLNPGNIMSVIISDVHKDGTITNTGLLNRRAEGFKWTFSFIVNFAAETQKAELKEAILLLDEPARNLHPTQQLGISDLLKNLTGSNQVLYATHSPFMIFDYTPGNLLVVELDRKKHLSRIFYDYWKADDATLTPILYGLSRD